MTRSGLIGRKEVLGELPRTPVLRVDEDLAHLEVGAAIQGAIVKRCGDHSRFSLEDHRATL